MLASLDGSVRADGEIERPSGHEGADQWMAASVRLVRSAIDEAMGGAATEILCAGISAPGLIDVQNGVLIESTELGVHALPVASHWRAIARDVYVDNDARCSAWQLARSAPGQRIAILVQVKLHQTRDGSFRPSGAGIGLAYLIEGAFFNGSHRAAGELRGIDWTTDAPDQLGLSLETIAEEHGRTEALRRLVRELLRNLSVVISAFDPDIVVIAGDLVHHRDLVAGELSSPTIRRTVAGQLAAEERLIVAAPDQYPPVQGATGMALEHLFGSTGPTGSVSDRPNVPAWQTVLDAAPRFAARHSR
jgi:predicted NBD/HSP70 family sugar kinase